MSLNYKANVNSWMNDSRLPLIIGVTGHRDIRECDVCDLRQKVAEIIDDIRDNFLKNDENIPIYLLTSLAEGADQLVAEVALEHGIELIVLLPMSLDEYQKDFKTCFNYQANANFKYLYQKAKYKFVVPTSETKFPINFNDETTRAHYYRAAGIFMIHNCHLLIALWNGDEKCERIGGTTEIVNRRRYGVKLNDTDSAKNLLDNSEIGPLIIINTPRQQDTNQYAKIYIYKWGYLEKNNSANPNSSLDVWSDFEKWIDLVKQFNFDLMTIVNKDKNIHELSSNAKNIFSLDNEIISEKALDIIYKNALIWLNTYVSSDYLARYYQYYYKKTWIFLFSATFFMASILAYSNITCHKQILMTITYQILFIISFFYYYLAKKNQYQNKFLNYRALSEACRVALFWRIAKIKAPISSVYPITRSAEISWIRKSIQSIELANYDILEDLQIDNESYFICKNTWIKGQLNYYTSRETSYTYITNRRNLASTCAVILSATSAMIIGSSHYFNIHFINKIPEQNIKYFLFFSGLLPIATTLIVSYSEKLSLNAQARQFKKMSLLYERAYMLLPNKIDIKDNDLVKKIFIELGRESLQETSSWNSLLEDKPIKML